jgi:membrane protease YdiL (CAAX protease family)
MSDQPPGGTFTLEGRPAPGLYLVAWLLSGGGLALIFIAFQTAPPAAGVLLMGGLLMLLAGLSAGAGYQLVVRRRRPAEMYRGPSPLLLLAVWFVAVNVLGVLLVVGGLSDPRAPITFLAVGALQAALYFGVVWLFVVRSGAMSWRDMRLPPGSSTAGATTNVLVSAALMVPATFAALLLAAVVAGLLGTRAPEVVPAPQTGTEMLIVALVAALLLPIGEEIFFRGYALSAWLRDLGPKSALIRSTLFFAAIHVANVRVDTFDEGWRQAALVLAVIVPVGAVLGWLMVRRGLIGAITGHVTYNGILVGLLFLAQTLPPPA